VHFWLSLVNVLHLSLGLNGARSATILFQWILFALCGNSLPLEANRTALVEFNQAIRSSTERKLAC
jgi:hypothetical protein